MDTRVRILIGVVLTGLAAVAAFWLLRPQPATPVARGPQAVLLIPGYGGEASPLAPLQTALQEQGYLVQTVSIGDGTGDLEDYAQDVADRARELLEDGASSVSSVGFSAGGLIGRIAAVEAPEAFDDVVSLASPHSGTLWAALAGGNCPTACQQMRPGSDLLASLPDAPDADDWLSVYSTTDEVIVPADSSALAGAEVITIQSLTPGASVRHSQVPGDPAVIAAVVDFLADPD